MQEAVYKCDTCKKVIGQKKHISLNLNYGYSGIAVPPSKGVSSWTIKKGKTQFIHFCKGKCAGEFFDKLIQEIK